MHTFPSVWMLGCHISVVNCISGGLLGKSLGNFKSALKNPPSYIVPSGPAVCVGEIGVGFGEEGQIKHKPSNTHL